MSNLPKVLGTKFLGSDGLSWFISTYKYGSFKKRFTTLRIFQIQKINSAGRNEKTNV